MINFDKYIDLYDIQLKSEEGSVAQSDEIFTAQIDGNTVEFSMHDYRSMYRVPWLYDSMIFDKLNCQTPYNLADRVKKYIDENWTNGETLRILEIGAGSGAFGEALKDRNIGDIIWGLDIIEEAKLAADRDRPGVYDNFLVADLCTLGDEIEHEVSQLSPNCVAVASATGWGNHIPVAGFENAFRLLGPNGLFVFHVKPNDPDPECIALNKWIEKKIDTREMIDAEREIGRAHV